jgi:hypothetical protein
MLARPLHLPWVAHAASVNGTVRPDPSLIGLSVLPDAWPLTVVQHCFISVQHASAVHRFCRYYRLFL